MKSFEALRRIAAPALGGIALALALSVYGLSPPPPQPDDELFPLLYEELGGESWTRSDGWFDPDVHWCDWYGVECGPDYMGYYVFEGLDLADNSLVGEMSEELADLLFANAAPSETLNLSDNAIGGPFHFYPRTIDSIDLSGNRLSGALPTLTWPTSVRPNGIGTEALAAGQRLDLGRNAFSGSIPEDWSEASLKSLDLSDNQLTGGHQTAIDAIKDDDGNGYVYLTGNPFEGELTSDVFGAPLAERDQLGAYGGIDICFTNLTINDPDVRDWLAEHHVASADFDQCLGRERTEVDATLSGSWFNPERSGEGVSLMILENGAPLLYSFSFDLDGNQQWTFEVGTAGERFVEWAALKETAGTFNQGIGQVEGHPFIRPTARARLDRIGPDTLNVYRRYTDARGCGPWPAQRDPDDPILCPIDYLSDRMDYQRLTELAGTTCENRNVFQRYSGAWYNPERSGEGFVVEVLPDERAVVYWFTYKPDDSGEQAWMIGTGDLSTSPLSPADPVSHKAFLSVTLFQPLGGTYGPGFDPARIELIEWGELRLEFSTRLPFPGEVEGRVKGFESALEGYGSDEYSLEPLALPMLADCESERAP